MNKIMINALALAAISMMAACGSDDEIKVADPHAYFCTVNDDNLKLSEISFDSYESFKMVDICSNVSWSVASDADWLTVSNHSGGPLDKENLHLKLSVKANDTGADRTATVRLTGAQGQSAVLNVTQSCRFVDPTGWQSATEAVNSMKVGLNLFNTFDANGTSFDQDDVTAFETCWGQPVADRKWFETVRDAGFPAVRIPVTWFPHMTAEWEIKKPWIDRVEEVVNYALDAGLYVILNVHHDTGAHDQAWLRAEWSDIEAISGKFTSLWTQIATRFKDYDHHLLFESYNEILDSQYRWNTPANDDSYKAVNRLAQDFVTTVRATGGNNEHRNIIVNTYSAHGAQVNLDKFAMPTDPCYPDHLLLQVHNYSPWEFCAIDDDAAAGKPWTSAYESQLKAEMDILINFANTTHIPVVIGESGASTKNTEEDLVKYGEVLTTYPRSQAPIAVFLWSGVIDRKTYKPYYESYMQALLKGTEY